MEENLNKIEKLTTTILYLMWDISIVIILLKFMLTADKS